MVPQQREPWATIQTKKPHALLLHLIGPKGRFGLGRALELGADRHDLDESRLDLHLRRGLGRELANVRSNAAQLGVHYPIALDNGYGTWNAYNNEYWPAEYLIDGRGRIRLVDFGEGDYGAKERAIRSLLAEQGASRLGAESRVRAPAPSQGLRTPETYLGANRAEGFTNGPIPVGRRDFGNPPPPPPNGLAYHGTWTIGGDSATAGRDAAIALHFEARRVFIVLGSPDEARSVRVLLDGKAIPPRDAGADVRSGLLRVRAQRLYSVVDLPRVESRTVTLRFQPGITGYSFTFG